MNREKYDGNIKENAEMAKKSEDIVIELMTQLKPGTEFKSLHDDTAMWHYGDILGTDGKYYDAKDDGLIYRTGNVFAEDVIQWDTGEVTNGWMRNSKYNYVCVLDLIECNMWVLDFKELKRIYRDSGNVRRPSYHKDKSVSYGYCVPLWKCRENNVIVYETQFYYDEAWGMYIIGKEA